MFNPPTKNNSGFSLIEIVVVMLVIAILVVLAIPQMTSNLQLNRIQTGSSIVATKLGEAKLLAIKQNKQVSFVLDEINQQIWIEANSTKIGATLNLPQNIKIKISPDTTATKEFVTFNSMGALVTTPSTISTYYALKQLEVPVDVSISGKVTIGKMRSY